MKNRSVPTDIVLPHLAYQDVAAAIEWLTRTFGFIEHYRYGDPAQGAQMYFENFCLMLSSSRTGWASPKQTGCCTQMLSVFVADVDAHFARTKTAGATIIEDLHETIYGERQYVAEDPEGHRWLFSQHAKDISPDQWGAVIANALQV